MRYTKWRGGRLKRMVSAKNVVKEGKYDSAPVLQKSEHIGVKSLDLCSKSSSALATSFSKIEIV